MKRSTTTGRRLRGTYVATLMAISVSAGMGTGWGQNQAVNPVDIGGRGGGSTPAAGPQVGVPAAPATSAPAAAAVPAAPAAPAVVAPAPAVTPTTVAAPAVTPTAPVAAPAAIAAPATQAIVPVPVAPTTAAAQVPAAVPETLPATAPAIVAPTTVAAPVTPATPAAPATSAAATAPAAPITVPATQTAATDDGRGYPVSEIKVDYKFPHPQLPAIGELMESSVQLGVSSGGYVAPRPGVPVVTVKLSEIGKGSEKLIYRSGITAIYAHILRFYNARGIIGVFVVVDPADIQMDERDPRKDKDARLVEGATDQYQRTSLQFVVVTSVVKQVRTVAIGETSDSARVDNPRHEPIREHSPLQPATADTQNRQDLLRKDVLDEYVLRLNRYPGRRVDIAMSGTQTPGELNLDYLVSENRPWYAFLQVSNTGTSDTATFRERFGFVDNQLTGHDDILTLDYSTADFSKSHSVDMSYELPFFNLDRVRYRAYALWNEYTASDVGQNNVSFNGSSWAVGNELTLNIFQKRDLFVDAVAGFRAQGMETENQAASTHGQATYFNPYIGLKLERLTDISTTTGSVMLVDYFTNSDVKDVAGLGTPDPSINPIVLQYMGAQSLYLEPLLDADRFARGESTLAHEVYFTVHGQYAFGNRLVPQAQDVAGGLFSVRGYPESIAAGDSTLVGSLEYRFHVPRALAIQNDPSKTPFLMDKSFRFSPQQPYGRPDWDLILRGFLDAGEVWHSQKQATEANSTLVGTGVGFELQYKQNFNLRLDWGTALNAIVDPTTHKDTVKEGSQRVHITATILY